MDRIDDERPPARILLLKLEGVAVPEAFVVETLHAYAHDHLPRWLGEHLGEADVRRLVLEVAGGGDPGLHADHPEARERFFRALHAALHEADRPRALDDLVERIWVDGCRRGQIRAELYDDALRSFARWPAAGRVVSVISGIGVDAQRELLAHSDEGDLTPLVAAWFDHRAGSRTESATYAAVTEALGASPHECLYVSDSLDEARAAAGAGMGVLLVERSGTVIPADHAWPMVDDLELL